MKTVPESQIYNTSSEERNMRQKGLGALRLRQKTVKNAICAIRTDLRQEESLGNPKAPICHSIDTRLGRRAPRAAPTQSASWLGALAPAGLRRRGGRPACCGTAGGPW